ncbi:MAG TPA: M1 family metallopeptidase [Longimicrobiales bacterium]
MPRTAPLAETRAGARPRAPAPARPTRAAPDDGTSPRPSTPAAAAAFAPALAFAGVLVSARASAFVRARPLAVALALAAVLSPARAHAQRAVEPPPIEAGRAPRPGPYAPGFDAVHYDLALTLPDTGAYIRGVASARIALVEPRRDTLALDLSGLAVERARIGGRDVAYRHEAGKVYLPVPADADVGDTLVVEVAYAGTPDDGLIIGPNVHGRRTAFADNWPDRARFWFPSIDHPSDKATVAFAVSAPAPWMVVANGERVDAVAVEPPAAPPGSTAPRRTWRWAVSVPIPTYTMVVGAAEFAVGRAGDACARTGDGRCIETTWWAFPPDTSHAARVFARADEMVAFYSERVAPFPYAKLAHVQSSTRYGGMENVSAIFYAEEAIASGRDIEPTVAHETAHQWFGDAVTEADWHDLWLSEGFATYFGALFFEHADGAARFREMMEANRRAYFRSDVVGRPIVDPAEDDLFDLLNANSYQKGAWVLHMLRGLLGDAAFFDGIRRYYRAHEHGTARTADLQRALEAASGRELGDFFRQWVYSPGHPRVRVGWTWDAEAGAVAVVLEQVQPAEWPVFDFPLELELTTPAGAVRRTVEVDARREEFRIPLPAAPTTVRADPDVRVLVEVVGR